MGSKNPEKSGSTSHSAQVVRAQNDRQPTPLGLQSEPDLGHAGALRCQPTVGRRHYLCAVTWRGFLLPGGADGPVLAEYRGLGAGGDDDRRLDPGRVADGDPQPATGRTA